MNSDNDSVATMELSSREHGGRRRRLRVVATVVVIGAVALVGLFFAFWPSGDNSAASKPGAASPLEAVTLRHKALVEGDCTQFERLQTDKLQAGLREGQSCEELQDRWSDSSEGGPGIEETTMRYQSGDLAIVDVAYDSLESVSQAPVDLGDLVYMSVIQQDDGTWKVGKLQESNLVDANSFDPETFNLPPSYNLEYGCPFAGCESTDTTATTRGSPEANPLDPDDA